MHKIDFKKGASEMIGFSIALIIILNIFAYLLSMVVIQDALADMTFAVNTASREAIVCDSMESATQTATDVVNELIQRNGAITETRVDVRYTPGSEQEWKKGNFIDVAIICKIRVLTPLIDDERHVKQMRMIV